MRRRLNVNFKINISYFERVADASIGNGSYNVILPLLMGIWTSTNVAVVV
jgi:hypothetical protein